MRKFLQKIKVKNFGPIREGYKDTTDGFLNIKKTTIFIGKQMSGKSSLAKLISSFLWLEKSLLREDMGEKLSIEYVSSKEFFVELFDYHNITEYFTDKTEIEYYGQNYLFKIKGKSLSCEKYSDSIYEMPKIMYISSERNFISNVKNPQSVAGLPPDLYTLLEEYINACNELGNSTFRLPVDNVYLKYNEYTKTMYVIDNRKTYEIGLHQASSGVKSLSSMSLVTDYLASSIYEASRKNIRKFSLEYTEKIKKKYSMFLASLGLGTVALGTLISPLTLVPAGLTTLLTAAGVAGLKFNNNTEIKNIEKKDAVLYELLKSFAGYYNALFYNIVEEPEQNLFPTSQVAIINDLLKGLNKSKNNQLIITTHSPYILSALNNYIYANKLVKQGKTIDFIPSEYLIPYESVIAYKLDNGCIKNIMDDNLQMIDTTAIDDCSSEINEVYDKLFSLEYDDGTCF